MKPYLMNKKKYDPFFKSEVMDKTSFRLYPLLMQEHMLNVTQM